MRPFALALALVCFAITLQPLKPSRCIKASFYIPENRLNFPTTKGFRKKLAYQYIAIFFNFLATSSHLHPLQVENCDSNSRLVVDEDDNGKFRLERVLSVIENEMSVWWVIFSHLKLWLAVGIDLQTHCIYDNPYSW